MKARIFLLLALAVVGCGSDDGGSGVASQGTGGGAGGAGQAGAGAPGAGAGGVAGAGAGAGGAGSGGAGAGGADAGASGAGAGGEAGAAGAGGEAGASGEAGAGGGTAGMAGQGGAGAGPVVPVPVLAFRRVAVGDVDLDGNSGGDAWKHVGRNVDGVTSTAADTKGHCKPKSGGSKAQIQEDGDGGLDNSFARNVLPVFTSLIGVAVSDQINDAISKGEVSVLLRLEGLGAGSEQASVPSSVFIAGSQESSPTDVEWAEGSFVWHPAPENLATLDPLTSSLLLPKASLAANQWSSNGAVAFSLKLPVYQFVSILLPLGVVSFDMKLSDDHKTARGQLGAVVETKVLVEEMHKLVGLYGAFTGQDYCNSSLWESLKSQLEQASDIMKDGSQDETQECDGISLGLSFEAGSALVGEAGAELKPTPEGCGG